MRTIKFCKHRTISRYVYNQFFPRDFRPWENRVCGRRRGIFIVDAIKEPSFHLCWIRLIQVSSYWVIMHNCAFSNCYFSLFVSNILIMHSKDSFMKIFIKSGKMYIFFMIKFFLIVKIYFCKSLLHILYEFNRINLQWKITCFSGRYQIWQMDL